MLPSWSSKYVGLPFEQHGRGPDTFDCWGLARWVLLQEYNIHVPSYAENYEAVFKHDEVAKAVMDGLSVNWNRVDKPQTGDLVIFNIFGKPVHVALVLDKIHFLHCPEDDMSRIERLNNRFWERRVEGFYRHV